MIPEESDEDLPVTVQGDSDEADTIPFIPGDSEDEQFNTAIDDTSEDPMIVMGKPLTTAFVSANVCITTEKVGCLQVTNKLREFLNHFPPESREKAFEQIYEILQVLEAYLIDNPQQHTHCMSPDNEYISLIMYAITIEIDLCNFPAIWAVLSILLDTQSNTLQHVKSLQQAVNKYYDKCPMDVMSRLEHQASNIMKAMYDSINNDNFDSVSDDIDRVSGAVDNDYDANDYDKDEHVMPYDKDEHVMPYDKDEHVMPYDSDNENMPDDNDNDQMPAKYANDYETVSDKVQHDENMENYESNDRILNSVCHRLDLGPNMLPGAQQHTTVESVAALKIQDKTKGKYYENVMAYQSGYFIFFYISKTLQMNQISFMASLLNAVL